MRNVADGQPAERLGDDERHLGLEVRGQLADVDDVDVGLGELAVAALLGPLAAPDLLDLVAAEREGELPGVLEHVARERHGEVEVQAELGVLAAVSSRGEPADAVDLLVGVAALAEQPLDGLDGPGLERREAVQLEDLADDVEDVQLEEPLGGQELGEPRDRGHLPRAVGGASHAVNPRRYGLVARSRRIVVAGPWPGRTSVESGSGRTTSRSERCIAAWLAAGRGRCGRWSRRTGRRRSPSVRSRPSSAGRPSGHGVEAEHHRALGVAGRVEHLDVEPGEGEHLAVGDLDDALGLAPGGPLPELLLQHRQRAGGQSWRAGRASR